MNYAVGTAVVVHTDTGPQAGVITGRTRDGRYTVETDRYVHSHVSAGSLAALA